MQSVMLRAKNPHTTNGKIYVRVEPSLRITHGVYVDVNQEFNLDNAQDAAEAAAVIKDKWDVLLSDSMTISSKVIATGGKA